MDNKHDNTKPIIGLMNKPGLFFWFTEEEWERQDEEGYYPVRLSMEQARQWWKEECEFGYHAFRVKGPAWETEDRGVVWSPV